MITVSSHDVRTDLRGILDVVAHKDEHVEVSRYNTPTAVIVPIRWYEKARKLLGEKP